MPEISDTLKIEIKKSTVKISIVLAIFILFLSYLIVNFEWLEKNFLTNNIEKNINEENQDQDINYKILINAHQNPSKGDEDAPVLMMACIDYECEHCASFATKTLPKIEEKYINTGKLVYVLLDYPMPAHQNADGAAIAANCAGEQGKYWEMHDLIFSSTDKWYDKKEREEVIDAFLNMALSLNLNINKFRNCTNDKKQVEEIKTDINECSKGGVDGTPTFFINGIKVVGSRDINDFIEVIDAAYSV